MGKDSSGVTQVDPGQIKDFAKFLDEMTSRVQDLVTAVGQESGQQHLFGHYDESAAADAKFASTVSTSHQNLAYLKGRFDNLTTGTHHLSARYTDLEQLNTAQTSDVTAALAAKE